MQGSIGVGTIRPGEMHLKPVLTGDVSNEMNLVLDFVADIDHDAIKEFGDFVAAFIKKHNIDLVFIVPELSGNLGDEHGQEENGNHGC